MIRLTLNAHNEPEIHLFNKSTILLGAESTDVDLGLPGVDIQPLHLKICEQDGFVIIVNLTNDPFVSVNGNPFGKKLLNTGDVILVHQTTILFEKLTVPAEPTGLEQQEVLASLLECKIKEQEELARGSTSEPFLTEAGLTEENPDISYSFKLPFEEDVDILKDEDWQKGSLESYLSELESVKPELEKANAAPATEIEQPPPLEKKAVPVKKTGFVRKNPISLKDDYLRDLDDDNQNRSDGKEIHSNESSHLYQAWKWILVFIFTLLALTGVVGSILYFNVSDRKEAQETKAAQAVADISMALAYAQLDPLKPHNQNWSDADFLKNNLQIILPNTLSYASQIDAQGQLKSCPYSLRIYTNTDLSHYLLIAQPAPSLMYWLLPKPIIVVDSHAMELRTIKDVRVLNRLLANADPLEGSNGKEITALIKEGKLIRLSSLAEETGSQDFSPPKNLAWIRPGAENYIYNAPRYYRLGQNLIQKAMSLSTSKGTSKEVAMLKQDVENVSWLNHLILYSEQGKKSALQTRQGLMMFAPTDKLLFGYLTLNAQGKISQVYLLKDEDELKDSTLGNSAKETDAVAFQMPIESRMKEKEETGKNRSEERSVVDDNHPIYIQLQSLANARENELRPLTVALYELVNQDLKSPRPQFQDDYLNLSHHYFKINAKHKQIIRGVLDTLYRQYEDMPLNQFMAFVKELKLERLIENDDKSFKIIDENCQQNIESLLSKVQHCSNLVELNNHIQVGTTWLNFDCIKDPQELMKYQNSLRNTLLEKLELFLLLPTTNLKAHASDRVVLQQILGQERLIQGEERDYFLSEFDELLEMQELPQPDLSEVEETMGGVWGIQGANHF